jgi:type IV fimbrial biogenesis protein FimT
MVVATCLAIPQMAKSVGIGNAKSTARGVMTFIDDAKSLARIRNQVLWVEVSEGEPRLNDGWSLRLRTSTDLSVDDNILQQFPGDSSLILYSGYLNDLIMVDGLKSKISNGSLTFGSKQTGVPSLKVITSYAAGRIRICSEEEKLDGIPLC